MLRVGALTAVSLARRAPTLVMIAALVVSACTPARLAGTDLGKGPAPDFTLTDGPTGEVVTLSALRGRVIVLSFLYADCPDVCPLTAEKLRAARTALGDAASDLSLVAVSVAPGRDTPDSTRRFLADHRLTGAMRFLIGGGAALAAVWSKYGIAAEPQGAIVGHNDAIFLIDRQGRERVLLHSDTDPADLLHDLRVLLAERRLF